MEEERRDLSEATEGEEEESFEELLKASLVDSSELEPGSKIEAKVLKITPEWVFLDLGRKSEGYLATHEILDDEGEPTVGEGDTLEAYFLPTRENEQLFTLRIGGAGTAPAYLEQAWQSGIPVEGLVEKEIKGGFEVRLAGQVRAFCPYSQMGLQRAAQPGMYDGQRLSFRITEFSEKGRNIVLSNRAVLEEELRKQKESLKASLHEGMLVKGRVTSIRNFGAFVNIGAIEGLLPVSEIGWGRVEDIREHLSEGQEVEVAVLKLDWEQERFSFSLRQTLPDPWDDVELKYPQGSVHTGKAVRFKNFGAFITLEPGVDGLVHISKLGKGKRINHPREVLVEGQDVEVKVESVDAQNRKLSLSLAVTGEASPEEGKESGDYRRYLSEGPGSSGSMGTLGELLQAKKDKKGGGKKRK